jgi:hypothetical protein
MVAARQDLDVGTVARGSGPPLGHGDREHVGRGVEGQDEIGLAGAG